MAIILQRQISESEKLRVLEIHGRVCYATGHPISKQYILIILELILIMEKVKLTILPLCVGCITNKKEDYHLKIFV
jgi:hypothetical protein